MFLYIETLYLKNFRNYSEVTLHFSNGTNLVLGENGAGKSNLLEAVYLLSTSKSFRNTSDQRVVRWDSDNFLVRGDFLTGKGSFSITVEYKKNQKNLYINGVSEKRLSSIIGNVYCVIFYFDDIYLVTGSPQIRRRFLDLILSMVDPIYFHNLKMYRYILRQKNSYLKDNSPIDENLLFTWNEQLIERGSYIIQKRLILVEFINSFIDTVRGWLEDLRYTLNLFYQSNIFEFKGNESLIDIQNRFREELFRTKDREIREAQAIIGPHRDDILFKDNKFKVRYLSSLGEARLISIILKLAQALFYLKTGGAMPILLIDDILLELDLKNMKKVLYLIGDKNQKIITTTERVKLPEIFLYDRLFNIYGNGNISWREKEKLTP